MALPFLVHDDAVEELERTLRGLEHPEAAGTLAAAVLVGLERVAAAPLAYPVVDAGSGIRRHVLPGLGRYGILYATNAHRTLVVAIADGRRAPGYWRTRLRDA